MGGGRREEKEVNLGGKWAETTCLPSGYATQYLIRQLKSRQVCRLARGLPLVGSRPPIPPTQQGETDVQTRGRKKSERRAYEITNRVRRVQIKAMVLSSLPGEPERGGRYLEDRVWHITL